MKRTREKAERLHGIAHFDEKEKDGSEGTIAPEKTAVLMTTTAVPDPDRTKNAVAL